MVHDPNAIDTAGEPASPHECRMKIMTTAHARKPSSASTLRPDEGLSENGSNQELRRSERTSGA